MKRLALGTPPRDPDRFRTWAAQALSQIELASHEDIELVFDGYRVVGAPTELRVLDVSTATHADVVNLLATLLTDLKKRGQTRNYDEV